MPALELVATSSLGSLLGMQHALEPDHLAAVSTLVAGDKSATKAAWLGACWGVGHMATLMLAGAALVVLRTELPHSVDIVFEIAVVVLLIAFGVRVLLGVPGRRMFHRDLPEANVQVSPFALARRPLLVGAVHGLAGSGALTAMVVGTLPTTGARLAYLALFGLGSIVGMALLSSAVGWPLARAANSRTVTRAITLAIGLVSTLLGLYWGYPLLGRAADAFAPH
jgi:hypothetical protein